jgi:hypothetical protein
MKFMKQNIFVPFGATSVQSFIPVIKVGK